MQPAANSVSFIVPCYNEAGNVLPTVESIRRSISGEQDYEIVLIDDCSRDNTLEEMRELAAQDPHIRVVRNEVNLGLGGAYKSGIAAASCTYSILVPGDDGFPAESLAKVLQKRGQADIVIPVVTNTGVRSPLRAFASKAFTMILNTLFGLEVGYYNGAVLHRNALLRTVTITTDSFAYQGEALVKLITRGASYTHCGVKIKEREAGRSTALSLKNQAAVWRTILHLIAEVGIFGKHGRHRRRPLRT